MARLLILQDPVLEPAMIRFLERDGHEVWTADGTDEARAMLREPGVRLFITPVARRGRSLLGFIEEVAAGHPLTAILLVVSGTTVDDAVELRMRLGLEMIRLPLALIDVRDRVRHAVESRDLNAPIAMMRQHLERLSAEPLSEASREILGSMSRDLETLAARVRSVTDAP